MEQTLAHLDYRFYVTSHRSRLCFYIPLILLVVFSNAAWGENYQAGSTLMVASPDLAQVALKFCHPSSAPAAAQSSRARDPGGCATFTFAHLSAADWVSTQQSALVLESYLATGHSLAIRGGDPSDLKRAEEVAARSMSPLSREYLRVSRQILARVSKNRDQCSRRILDIIQDLGFVVTPRAHQLANRRRHLSPVKGDERSMASASRLNWEKELHALLISQARATELAPKSRFFLLDRSIELSAAPLQYRICAPAGGPLECHDYSFTVSDAQEKAKLINAIFLLQAASNARVPLDIDLSSAERLIASAEKYQRTLSPIDRDIQQRIEKMLVRIGGVRGCQDAAQMFFEDVLRPVPADMGNTPVKDRSDRDPVLEGSSTGKDRLPAHGISH